MLWTRLLIGARTIRWMIDFGVVDRAAVEAASDAFAAAWPRVSKRARRMERAEACGYVLSHAASDLRTAVDAQMACCSAPEWARDKLTERARERLLELALAELASLAALNDLARAA